MRKFSHVGVSGAERVKRKYFDGKVGWYSSCCQHSVRTVFSYPSNSLTDPKQASGLGMMTPGLGHRSACVARALVEKRPARWMHDACGHGPSDRLTLTPKRWSPASVGRGGQDRVHPLLAIWCACPIWPVTRCKFFAVERLQWPSYIGRVRAVLRPHLAAAACRAAATPNPRHGLILGFPASSYLTAGERCIPAASKAGGGSDGVKVRNVSISCVNKVAEPQAFAA
jgi:hypothetical protein